MGEFQECLMKRKIVYWITSAFSLESEGAVERPIRTLLDTARINAAENENSTKGALGGVCEYCMFLTKSYRN